MRNCLYISSFSLGAIWFGLLPSQLEAQAPKLPFQVSPDGTVDQRELLKLTKRPVTAVRITDEELEAIKTKHKIVYDERFRPTPTPEMPPRGDLYANSVVITDGVDHTVIPKTALVWLPPHLEDKILEKPKGHLIVWPKFFQQNRTWLRPLEITLETAKGETALSEKEWEKVRAGNAIVVSVLSGFPISMLAPEPPAEKAIVGIEGSSPQTPQMLAAANQSESGRPSDDEEDAPSPDATIQAEDSEPAKVEPKPVPKTGTARSGAFDRLKRTRPSSGN